MRLTLVVHTWEITVADVGLSIADRRVRDGLTSVLSYLGRHHGTVDHFDLFEPWDPAARQVDRDLIRATRTPWMNSRISNEEMHWFIRRSKTAPWSSVRPLADLRDADPCKTGELWDKADALYGHFTGRRGVSHGKISKVLHLMRPRLAPIVDSRLWTLYRSQARRAARDVRAHREDFGYELSPWAAVREDLLANAAALEEIRRSLASDVDERARRVAEHVSDLRLLDMASWPLAA